MAAAERAKGRRYEQTTATFFRTVVGGKVTRGWQSREGSDNPDVFVQRLPNLWVECSHRAKGNWLYDKYEQAKEAAPKGHEVVIHAKADNKDDVVLISRDLWARLLESDRRVSNDGGSALVWDV